MQGFRLAALHKADTVTNLVHRDIRSLTVKELQFLQNLCRPLHICGLAQELHMISPAHNLAGKTPCERLQELIPLSQKCVCFLVIRKINRSLQCLLQ